MLSSTRPRKVGQIIFHGELRKHRGGWLVDSFAPVATFSPIGVGRQHETGPADYTGRSRARGLFAEGGAQHPLDIVPVGVLALVLLVPLGFVLSRGCASVALPARTRRRCRRRCRRCQRAAASREVTLAAMSRSVIVSAVRTPFGRLGGALAESRRPSSARSPSARPSTGPGSRAPRSSTRSWVRCCRAARARRPRGRRRSARPAGRGALRHDQQGCASSIRAVEIADQMIRAGDSSRRRRRHGVDVERPVRARQGPVRVQARRRDAGRSDDPRRSDLDASRPAHGRAGVVRLARARHLAARSRTLGAALARARGAGDRRGAASRTSSCRSATSRWTRGRGATLAREARRAEAGLRSRGDDDGGQRARRERRRRRARRHERGVRAASAGSRCSRRSSRRATSPTSSPISPARPRRPARSRSRRRARRSGTSSASS